MAANGLRRLQKVKNAGLIFLKDFDNGFFVRVEGEGIWEIVQCETGKITMGGWKKSDVNRYICITQVA